MIKRFFIVGAQRSGTTYLCKALDQHPEIEMAKPLWPEPKFFLRQETVGQGLERYDRQYFSGKETATARGEKSTSYIESHAAAERIATFFPDARILIALRNPVQRAISNYWFSVNNGVETLPMEEAFAREQERLLDYDPAEFSTSPFAYLKRGRYIDYIPVYERHFGLEQIKIILFEDMIQSFSCIESVFSFLEIDQNFRPKDAGRSVNASQKRSEPPPETLLAELKARFREASVELARRYALDLSVWDQ